MKKEILCIFVCTLLIATAVPMVSSMNIDKTNVDGKSINSHSQSSTPIYQSPHHISIHFRNVYILECGDEGINEPGEWYFYIFAIPKMFHFKTDIYSANDNIPETPQQFGKLCTISDVKFTPQRLFILAIDDDKGEGIANFNEFLDWTQIKFRPPKDDYPATHPYVETFKWVNIYFRADVEVRFYYVDV